MESGFTREAVEQLSATLNEPTWMREFRLEAFELYRSLPMPTTRDEPWRRTDIRALQLEAIGPLLNGAGGASEAPVKLPMTSLDELAGMLLQVDGMTLRRELDERWSEVGVIFTDMETAVREHGELLRKVFMTQAVRPDHGKFAALHAAFWRGGTFLYVPAGVEVDAPFQSVLWGTAGKTFAHTLVVLERDARATTISEFASETGAEQALHNGVVEMILRDSAHLNSMTVQEWGGNVWQFTHERALVGRDASLDWVIGSLGSRLTKSFQTVELDGVGANARISGLFFTDGRRHLDLDTQQNHNMPDTTSDLLFKGALKGKSRSVWQGMIRVLPEAQRTNGYQANRNLLLSKGARADSIPGLEIEADDVRCTHGATAGQVDEAQLFYLMSRGLVRADAIRLIVHGFFTPVLERISVPAMRERLEAAIDARI
jgi:Fe-S cluster assembly protein SufD